MALTPVKNLQLHNQIERVLHVQGNYRGGILEMAIVVDRTYEKEAIRTLCADLITSCKKQSDVFRNIRLNMVLWGRKEIRTETAAAAYVQMGTFFDAYEAEEATLPGAAGQKQGARREKAELEESQSVTEILEYLKKFHARSKLILLLTPDREKFYHVPDVERLRQALSPFLKQKLILVYPEEMESGIKLFMQS